MSRRKAESGDRPIGGEYKKKTRKNNMLLERETKIIRKGERNVIKQEG